MFEAANGPSGNNPYLDVSLDAVFSHKSREVRVPGFYDGDGVYRVPSCLISSEWSFKTRSRTAELDVRPAHSSRPHR